MIAAPNADKPSTALSRSIGGENLTAVLSMAVDAGMGATIQSLHGVPILGLLVGFAKMGRDVHKELEFRKIVLFLDAVSNVSLEKRMAFIEKIQTKQKMDEFGENVLLLIDRLDDMSKPGVVGKIMASHINGDIDYDKAMRLCAIVARCYASDIAYLKTFKPGLQCGSADIAAMLAADGLLRRVGTDNGSVFDQESGGAIYELSEYGHILLKYAI